MTNDRARKRQIRALMAETGLNYTRAMRMLDERRAKARAEAAEAAEAETEAAPAQQEQG
jgi:hypothetical protein